MKVSVYNLDNKETETIEVPQALFATPWKADVVHQALVTQEANSRNVIAHAKDRSEVRGGGRKPWKQKGTGRARHGSTRSPLWIGGGATFGPSAERVFEKKLNAKMRRTALLSVLSKKFKDDEVKIVSGFDGGITKTKDFLSATKNILDIRTATTLVFSDKNKQLHKVARNGKKIEHLSPKSLNVKDVLRPKTIIIEKEAIGEIIDHLKIV